jgi:hypothetical protein
MPSAIETTISLRSLFRNGSNQIAQGGDAVSDILPESQQLPHFGNIMNEQDSDVWAAWGNAT